MNARNVEHDLYLRKVSLGEIKGNVTGYASIDKPWLKYYSEQAISSNFAPMSMYQLMKSKNNGYEKDIAISYLGLNITYGELFYHIDLVAKAVKNLNIKQGEVVMMSMINTPEAEYLFYALNKLGIVVDCIDPRSAPNAIQSDLIISKARYFFCLDSLTPLVIQAMSGTYLEKIITISPTESLENVGNKEYAYYDYIMSWKEFLSHCAGTNVQIDDVYIENSPAVIVHTGGSTGIPKGVVLSNENCNSLIYQMLYGYSEFERNMIFLNIMPPFVALGLNNAMHLSACMGLVSVMVPSLNPEEFPELVIKYKPNIIMGGPIHFNLMLNNELLKKEDLSFIKICCAGGERLPLNVQQQFQAFLKEHNSNANVWIGYGATETSAGTTCMRNNCYKYGSVGIPYLQNVLEVFDTETGEKINGYMKIGELRVSSPATMIGYLGNVSDNTISVDSDGTRWYHTGDLAHFDEDGLVYIDGRIKRIILRRAYKIYPAHIETLILKHPAVKECAVVGIPDPIELNVPVANIVLKDEFKTQQKDVIDFVDKAIKEEINDFSMLFGYNFLDKLPLTPIGKIDFISLEKMGINTYSKSD